ncbi:MAG TPA: hypothetical protein VLO11_07610 [Luteolibacter sp.]|nr:hypothetical protein [Luteolibacter sp.]
MAREILTQCFGAKLDGIDKAEDLFARSGGSSCRNLLSRPPIHKTVDRRIFPD